MSASQVVYLDHAATTPLAEEVFSAMKPYFADKFGNPSSLHSLGLAAAQAVRSARERVAAVLHCRPNEIIFTSGGSEADNLALKGLAEARDFKGHIITSAIEHHAVLDTAAYLESAGVAVTYVGVDSAGRVNPKDIIKAIRPDTFLASIMYANNEIGAIEPIAEIGKEVRRRKIIMHTDAVQAPMLLPLKVDKLHVDMLSLSAHKFYGPKGIGLLYARRGIKLAPQIIGGGQENKRRAGTENVPGIAGLAAALSRAEKNRSQTAARLEKLRDWLINKISREIPQAILTGPRQGRLANNVSFCFPALEGELLVLRLAERGFACSSGSACTTGSLEPSHVLLACGLDRRTALGSLRLSLGQGTNKRDLESFCRVLQEEADKLSLRA